MNWLVALHLVVLQTLDGREVAINPAQVTSLHAAKPHQHNKMLSNDVRCMVGLTDGKFVSVAETCDTVKQLLEENTR